MSKVYIFKLISGEEIISQIEEHSQTDLKDSYYLLNYPFKINSEYHIDEKYHTLHLTKWMPFSIEEKYWLPINQVIIVGSPLKIIEEEYFNNVELFGETDEMKFLKNWNISSEDKKNMN